MSDARNAPACLRIFLAGVGGQGVVTAAGWLALAADSVGLRVVVGQAHNMSQRGGCVSAAVVIEAGPVAAIGPREADVLVALEPMEAARAAHLLRPQGLALVDPHPIPPFTLAQAGLEYPAPHLLLADLEQATDRCFRIPAHRMAAEGGDPRDANLLHLGALQGLGALPWKAGDLRRAVLQNAPTTWEERVVLALQRGQALGRELSIGTCEEHLVEPSKGELP